MRKHLEKKMKKRAIWCSQLNNCGAFTNTSRSHASRVVHLRDNEFILEHLVNQHLGMPRR